MKSYYSSIKFLSLLLVLFSSIPSFGQGYTGLIGRWPFNGDASDVSGHGLNGIIRGATPTFGSMGTANTAYNFNGVSTYITVPYNSLMNAPHVSMCAKVKVHGSNSGPCQGNAIMWRGEEGTPTISYQMEMFDNPFDNDCSTYSPNNEVFGGANGAITGTSDPVTSFYYTPPIDTGVWYCVVITYDGDTLRTYVDGTLKSRVFRHTIYTASTDSLNFGKGEDANPFEYFLNGAIDEIRIYNRPLTQAEVTQFCDSMSMPSVGSCNTLNLADTIATCQNTTITLPATITGAAPLISVRWFSPMGISDTTILAPTLTVGTTSSIRYITVRSILPGAVNEAVNGDFEAGNTGFGSSYTYTPGPAPILNEGFYSVYPNPNGVHSGFTAFGDHTTGAGNMLIINGAGSPVDIWCETITVTPNTDYDFSAWFANCSSGSTGINSPILQFKINGVLLSTPTTLSSAPGVWNEFQTIWNSGASTSANICISNLVVTTAGNDFVIDDIAFKPYCTARDSVYVRVIPFDTTFVRHDTAVCAGTTVTLTAPTGYTADTFSNGSTATTMAVTVAGTYWVTSANNCSRRIDTFHVVYNVAPTVNLGRDTALCSGLSVTLSSTQPLGSTYLWSTGSTSNPIVVTTTGDYWLAVTRLGCVGRDTVHVTFSPHAVVNLGPDTANCDGLPVVLQSSVAYTAPTYLWNTGATTASITAITTGTYWLQVTDVGCPGADTIHVLIIYDTLRLQNRDTAICMGQVVQVLAGANPSATYQWLPTAGIANPTIIAPIITPDTSAMYYVTVNLPGCPPKSDSFYIDVQPYPQFYLGGNRFVCMFDTLHMNAHVSPGWYGGFTYNWVPAIYLDNNNTANVVYTPGVSQNYVLTVSNSAGCIAKDSVMVNVQAGNFAAPIADLNICPHDSVQLSTSGGATYQWYPSATLSSPTTSSPWATPVASTIYSVVVTSAAGCTDTVTVHVNVWPAALITLADSVTLYPGETCHLTPASNCSSFLWFPTAGVSNVYLSDPEVSPDFDTKYIVYGTTEHGCAASDSIYVYVSPESLIDLPNAFTPGTGNNGTFSILKKGYASLNYFRVFNRWGNLVFETKNISQGWDGTYKGEPQPFDVYVYDIQAVTTTGKVFNKHGNVTLLR